MLPYIFLLLISAVFPPLFYQYKNEENLYEYEYLIRKINKLTIIIFFGGLFILLALRDISVGSDLGEYQSIFEYCGDSEFDKLSDLKWEIGYTFYNKLLFIISNSYRLFLIVTSAIILIPIYKLYSQERRYSFLLIVLFLNIPCFLMIFSGLRQAMAISVGILVYLAIKRKKYILSILLIFLAASFHISAFILFLLYPSFYFKIKVKHLLYILPAMIAIYIFKVQIFKFLIALMPERYVQFYGDVRSTGAFGMLILITIFTTFSFVILDEESMSKEDYFMRNVLLIAAIFQIFVPVHGLIQRASYYFLIFVPVSILSVVSTPKRKLKNISNVAVVVMGCFFALYFFYNASFSTDNLLNVFPYKFFWE